MDHHLPVRRTSFAVAGTLAVGLLLVASMWGCAGVARAGEPQVAPLNQEFAAYLQRRVEVQATGAAAASAPKSQWGGLGLIPSPVQVAPGDPQALAAQTGPLSFSSTYDLRTLNKLTPIKNQNPYGTCWAFASMGSLESCLKPDEVLDFSENNLVNLHGFDWGYDTGGNHTMSTAYMARWSGPVAEASDPYPNVGGSTPLDPIKHVHEVLMFTGRTSSTANDTLKQAVTDYGAVYVTMQWVDSAYNATNKAYYYTGSGGNHAVCVVGWDDNFAASKFNTPPAGNGAFVVRNSWGTGWGEAGYFYASYYDTAFATSDCAVFMRPKPTTFYTTIYQYDPLGWVSDVGYSVTVAWGAAIFTATNSDAIRAVGTYGVAVGTSYEIHIRTGVTAGNPSSGTDATPAGITGTWPLGGFHTVDLPTPVPVTAGTKFAVLVKYTTPGYNYPVPFETAYAGYSSAATANLGETFVSNSGSSGSWTDLHGWSANSSACLKAYSGGYFESDVAPRGTGGDGVVSIADWVQVGRFAAALDPVTNGPEFQKADCAPRGTCGDGAVSIADWVQAGRYAAALDPCQNVSGATCP